MFDGLPALHCPAAQQVLCDALLELAHPFGLRLRATTRDDADERHWLAHFALLRSAAELELNWQAGIVEHAVIRGGAATAGSSG